MKIEKVYETKSDCSGCTACMNICPVSAIKMKRDEEGFSFPHIDLKKCIQCHQCVNVCPFNQEKYDEMKYSNLKCYAVKHKNNSIRKSSTSGGVFTALSDFVLEKKGNIYGAGFDENMKIIHKKATNANERDEFKGSKYVQSDLTNIFNDIKKQLLENKYVLFTGTPCQIAGLRSFLNNINTDKLILCDIVCHGVPSPKVWEEHVKLIEKKYNAKLIDYKFRDKSCGWKNHLEKLVLSSNKSDSQSIFSQRLKRLFYRNITLRLACHKCYYSNVDRVSDITIADFWKGEKHYPDFFDNDGISLVLINNPKGNEIFSNISDKIDYIETDIQHGLQDNLVFATKPDPERQNFFEDLNNKGYKKTLYKYSFPGKKIMLKTFAKKILFYKNNKW